MATNWREYQEEAGEFFRSLGMDACVDVDIEGARGVHSIDVWIVGRQLGIEVRWVVECKFWKSPVPKEKVLALHQIAQDIGVDRAFLLSESGFQAGAIRVALNTNVTLTSLTDLRGHAQVIVAHNVILKLARRQISVDKRLHSLIMDDNGRPGPQPGIDFDDVLNVMAACFKLKMAIPKALAREFPVSLISRDLKQTVEIQSPQSFVHQVTDLLAIVESFIKEQEVARAVVRMRAKQLTDELIAAVRSLLVVAEKALLTDHVDEESFEIDRLRALDAMKEIGRTSDDLKPLTSGALRLAQHALMRLLTDSVYLHLTKRTIPAREWELARGKVNQSIATLRAAAQTTCECNEPT